MMRKSRSKLASTGERGLTMSCALVIHAFDLTVCRARRRPEFHSSLCCASSSLILIARKSSLSPSYFSLYTFVIPIEPRFSLRLTLLSLDVADGGAFPTNVKLYAASSFGLFDSLTIPWFQGVKSLPRRSLWPRSCHLTNNRSRRTHIAPTPLPPRSSSVLEPQPCTSQF